MRTFPRAGRALQRTLPVPFRTAGLMLLGAAGLLAFDLALTSIEGFGFGAFAARGLVLLLVLPGASWYIARLVSKRSREREEALHERQESLLRNISDLVLVLDDSGIVRYQSASIARTLGYGADELIGSNVENLISVSDSESVLDLFRRLAPGGRAHAECQIRKRDGYFLPVEVSATNVEDEAAGGDLVVTMHDVSKWKDLEEQLTQQAFHDPLTSLPNRLLYIDRLEHALARQRRHARQVAVLFLDLDDFKNVNDSLGHDAGDVLIQGVAVRLARSIRPGDTAARLGGDEFALLLEDVDQGQAAAVAARVLGEFEQPFDLGDRSLLIGGSVGIALSSDDLQTSKDMLRAADTAMYEAKDAGKRQYRVFEPSMQRASAERLRLGADLRDAVERGELVLNYQPIVELPSGRAVGMEALLRWHHPELGLLGPMEFIPLAERSGMIVRIGAWVVREACRQAREWLGERADPPVGVSVNVSGVQLEDQGFVAAVSLALEEAELPPELLTLEVTESVMTLHDEAVSRRLRQLKGLGVRLALDDFGTGFSSLGAISRFPIDEVKIDKTFIEASTGGGQAATLVRSIVRLAHSLNLTVVAEGVEREDQAALLTAAAADLAQGFHFSRPLDARQASAFLLGHTNITFWTRYAGHELDVVREVVGDFELRNPSIRVDVVGGLTEAKIVEAVQAGTGPHVVNSFEADNFGVFAAPDGFIDLEPYLVRDGIDPDIFAAATRSYTREGGRRWALPMLADAYGLYYNREMFAAAGLTGPPRTIAELTEYAKRLTRRDANGSLAVVGFNPLFGFYENSVTAIGHLFGASPTTDTGRAAVGSDPGWQRMLRWQKELVDWYGYDDLRTFSDALGEEFSADHAFETGRLAMSLDGEWRIAFIAANGSGIDYAVAPMPVDESVPELYGSGFINGTVIGIPSHVAQRAEAWQLVKYLATDDAALIKLANLLRNLPSTSAALRSPDLAKDPNFAVFLEVFAHPRSTILPVTPVGPALENGIGELSERLLSGSVRDLGRELVALAGRIDSVARGGAREAAGPDPRGPRAGLDLQGALSG